MDKDFIVVLSKCDLLDEELKSEYAEEMIKNFGEIPHCMISAWINLVYFPKRHDLENTKRLMSIIKGQFYFLFSLVDLFITKNPICVL